MSTTPSPWIPAVEGSLPEDGQRVYILLDPTQTHDVRHKRDGPRILHYAATFVRGKVPKKWETTSYADQQGNNLVPYVWSNGACKWFGQDVLYWMSVPLAPRIASAALLLTTGEIVSQPPPARHPCLILDAQARGLDLVGHIQGFLTSTGEFVSRGKAYAIAVSAGQLLYDPENPPLGVTPTVGTLYSEDVW